jgi:hypothetical protein
MILQLARHKKESFGQVEILFSGTMDEKLASDGGLRGYILNADLLFSDHDSESLEFWFLTHEEGKPSENGKHPEVRLQEVALPLCQGTLRSRAMIGDAEYSAEIKDISQSAYTKQYSIAARITII